MINDYQSEFDAEEFRFCKVIDNFVLNIVKTRPDIHGLNYGPVLMFLTIDGIRYKVNSMETNYHTKIKGYYETGMKEGYHANYVNGVDNPVCISVDDIPEGFYIRCNDKWFFKADKTWLEEQEFHESR